MEQLTASPDQFDGQTPIDATPSRDLANSLFVLLELAGREIDADRDAARRSIRRAESLLRVELDRVALTSAPAPDAGKLAGWQVHRVTAYIDANLDRTIHIKDLGGVAKRSTAYFCRTFKRTFGETPHAYIMRRRLHHARQMMLVTDLALSEIATACGFTDQAHLCKFFRLSVGQSPAAWRRQRREPFTALT